MLIRRRYAEALGEFGLLPNQHAILAVLSTSGPMSQKQVAELTTVDAGDLVSYLDGLQARDAISRDRDPGDQRRPAASPPGQEPTLRAADFGVEETANFDR